MVKKKVIDRCDIFEAIYILQLVVTKINYLYCSDILESIHTLQPVVVEVKITYSCDISESFDIVD